MHKAPEAHEQLGQRRSIAHAVCNRRRPHAEHLKADGIPTMIYYPLPLHRQLAYQSERYSDQSFPVADQLCAEVLSLPMHTELTEQTQKLIIQSIQTFFAS